MKNFAPTFSRSTLLLAPDAILTLNQNITLAVCKDCGANSNIVDLVTRLSVNLSAESAPGTASFDLAIPKHSTSQFYNKGGKIDLPLMSEVAIYMKGRFSDTNGEPKYYRVFWGLLTSAEVTYSDGFYSVHAECADMLKWWDLSVVITQDSVSNSIVTNRGFRALSNVYSNLTAPEIIYFLGKSMFDEAAVVYQTPAGGNPTDQNVLIRQEVATFKDAQGYWTERFKNVGDAQLSLMSIKSERKGAIDNYFKSQKDTKIADLSGILSRTRPYNPITTTGTFFETNPGDVALPLFAELSGGQDPLTLGVDTALGIANKVKERINYEFFMDTGGIITFKAPYFNASTKHIPEYTIKDTDLFSYHISHNLDNIYTRIQVEGSYYHGSSEGGKRPSAFYTDPIKSKYYGIKQHEVQYSYIREVNQIYLLAVSELNRLNAKERTGTIDIVGRPELRLGIPVYLECEDSYVYVKSISHQFDFGQSFTTSIGFDTVRQGRGPENKSQQAEVESGTTEAEVLANLTVTTRGAVSIKGDLNTRYFTEWKKYQTGLKSKTLEALLKNDKEKLIYTGYEAFIQYKYSQFSDALGRYKTEIETSINAGKDASAAQQQAFNSWTEKGKIKTLADLKKDTNKFAKFQKYLATLKTQAAAKPVTASQSPPAAVPVSNQVQSVPAVKTKLQSTDKDGYDLVLGFRYGYVESDKKEDNPHLSLPPAAKFDSKGTPTSPNPNTSAAKPCQCGDN